MEASRRAVRALLACVLMVGCAQVNGQPSTQSTLNGLATFTQADLATAIAEAETAQPADIETITCFMYLSKQLAALQATQANGTGAIGAASAFEAGRLTVGNLGSAFGSVNKTSLEMACGPLAFSVINQANSIASEIAALSALIVKP